MFEVPALCDTQVVTGAGREREGSSSESVMGGLEVGTSH